MKSLSKYISYMKDLHSLNEYINEKLLINKDYKGNLQDVYIPDDIHITGEISRKYIIKRIEDYYGNDKNHKLIYDMFSSLNYDSYEYAFFDTSDNSDPHNKTLNKIFPNGIEYYKDNADDYIQLDDNNKLDYLIKLNTVNNDNKNTVVVWVSTEKEDIYIYIFWRAEI